MTALHVMRTERSYWTPGVALLPEPEALSGKATAATWEWAAVVNRATAVQSGREARELLSIDAARSSSACTSGHRQRRAHSPCDARASEKSARTGATIGTGEELSGGFYEPRAW